MVRQGRAKDMTSAQPPLNASAIRILGNDRPGSRGVMEDMSDKGLDGHFGAGPVNRTCVVLAAGLHLAIAVTTLIILIQTWPAAVNPADTELKVPFLFGTLTMKREIAIFIVTALTGSIGGSLHTLRSLSWYVGHRRLRYSWLLYYLLLPIVGSLLAILTYLVLRGTLTNGAPASNDINPYGFAAIGGLIGLFTDQAALKLYGVFDTLLANAKAGEGSNDV